MGPFIAKLFQVFSHWSLESQSQFRFQSTRTAGQLASQPASQPDKQTWLCRSHHDLKIPYSKQSNQTILAKPSKNKGGRPIFILKCLVITDNLVYGHVKAA